MSGFINRALEYEGDPGVWAMDIHERLKDWLPTYKIGGADLLIAVWEAPKDGRLKGSSLYMPDKVKDEQRHQGVTGLILKIGPLAYQSEKTSHWFTDNDEATGEPDLPKVGEWIQFNYKQGEPFLFGGQPCRLIADQYVMGRIPRPDLIA